MNNKELEEELKDQFKTINAILTPYLKQLNLLLKSDDRVNDEYVHEEVITFFYKLLKKYNFESW